MTELGPIIASIFEELEVDAASTSLLAIGLADADLPEAGFRII